MISSGTDHAQKLKDKLPLNDLLINELARLQKNDNKGEGPLRREIMANYVDHHAHGWYHDPNTTCAFAFCRPQQFSGMWNTLIQPSGNFVIIGEAASPHHA